MDQGTAYISKEMKGTIAEQGIIFEEDPIETPGSISVVARYLAQLLKAYVKIRQDL